MFLVQTAFVHTNTEPTISHDKAIQVKPVTNMIDSQVEFPTREQIVQTEKVETMTSSTGPADRHKKSTVLGIQILPQINIPGALIVQKTLAFSINDQGNTEIAYKADTPNVLFIEITPSEESIEEVVAVNNSYETRPSVCNLKERRELSDDANNSVSIQNLYHYRANPSDEKTERSNSSDQENALEKKDR